MKDFVQFLVTGIVKNPSDVVVTEQEELGIDENQPRKVIEIKVNTEDMGILIGKAGKTINSIRALAKTKAVREGVWVDVRIAEDA